MFKVDDRSKAACTFRESAEITLRGVDDDGKPIVEKLKPYIGKGILDKSFQNVEAKNKLTF